MLARGDTVGVFQMEGSGMRRFLTELKPTCFEDVIAAISLFRPGTLDAPGWYDGPHYIDRKHGKEPVEYDHPLLEPVLRDTYGVIMYQEQVMRAAQALAGYTLEEADILRAAMGKKNNAVMERSACALSTARRRTASTRRSPNRSSRRSKPSPRTDSTARTPPPMRSPPTRPRYLKAHYPHEFMAALMSLDMDDVDKTYKNIAALREMKIAILPPDVNQSRVKFAVTGDAIRFGLGAIRGVGQQDRRGDYRGCARPAARSRTWPISACASARS